MINNFKSQSFYTTLITFTFLLLVCSSPAQIAMSYAIDENRSAITYVVDFSQETSGRCMKRAQAVLEQSGYSRYSNHYGSSSNEFGLKSGYYVVLVSEWTDYDGRRKKTYGFGVGGTNSSAESNAIRSLGTTGAGWRREYSYKQLEAKRFTNSFVPDLKPSSNSDNISSNNSYGAFPYSSNTNNNSSSSYHNNNSDSRPNTYSPPNNTQTTNNSKEPMDWDDYNKMMDQVKSMSPEPTDYWSTSSTSTEDAINDLAKMLGGMAADNARREAEAIRRREAQLEAERQAAERERQRRLAEERETNRIYSLMTSFYNSFNTDPDVNYLSESVDNIYFYFATIDINKEHRSSTLYLSNIFAIPYNQLNSSWPFAPDIKNSIKQKYGDVIIKGYFRSLPEAQQDLSKHISKAQNNYCSVRNDFYSFKYGALANVTAQDNAKTDFWGNEKTQVKTTSNNSATGFWGNEVTTDSTITDVDSKPAEKQTSSFWDN